MGVYKSMYLHTCMCQETRLDRLSNFKIFGAGVKAAYTQYVVIKRAFKCNFVCLWSAFNTHSHTHPSAAECVIELPRRNTNNFASKFCAHLFFYAFYCDVIALVRRYCCCWAALFSIRVIIYFYFFNRLQCILIKMLRGFQV